VICHGLDQFESIADDQICSDDPGFEKRVLSRCLVIRLHRLIPVYVQHYVAMLDLFLSLLLLGQESLKILLIDLSKTVNLVF
jgi:hypothetical protein